MNHPVDTYAAAVSDVQNSSHSRMVRDGMGSAGWKYGTVVTMMIQGRAPLVVRVSKLRLDPRWAVLTLLQ